MLIPGLSAAEGALESIGLDLGETDALLRRHGVTRLANLTGLDAAKMPVWSCIRPSSKTLSVSFGKGTTDGQAQISAIMEALEDACAENAERLIQFRGTVSEISRNHTTTMPFGQLARVRPNVLASTDEYGWIPGKSLFSGLPVLAPFNLVGLNFSSEFNKSGSAFVMSSIGLGAGTDWRAATKHALQELIEYDALVLFETMPEFIRNYPTTSYQKGSSALVDEVFCAIPNGMPEPVFRIIQDTAAPVVMCEIPRVQGDGFSSSVLFLGSACRETHEKAFAAALQEALQVRVSHISGARDDLSAAQYAADHQFQTAGGSSRKTFRNSQSDLNAVDDPKITLNLEQLLARLKQRGLSDAWVFNLSGESENIAVVRVIAPCLSQPTRQGVQHLGAHALEALLRMDFGI